MTPVLPRRLIAKAPPIKTQGIKTKLVPWMADVISWSGQGRWIEPFFGSGAVALNIAPSRALLCDGNEHLIRFYQCVQTGEINSALLRDFLDFEGGRLAKFGEDHYYEIRQRFNETKSSLDFIFLNRSCFNGLMRFNKQGGFNVPFCRKPERFRPALITKICNQIDWAACVMDGKDWKFECQSWEKTLKQAKSDDFVYLDPPYIGRHADYYNQWSKEDADALSNAIKSLHSGFAYSMWQGNAHRENTDLISNFGDFHMEVTQHFYHLGATEQLRGEMREALVISHDHVNHARN